MEVKKVRENDWMEMFGDDDSDERKEEVEEDRKKGERVESLISFRKVIGIGGGRGVFAERDIEPGTLLLAEKPSFTWRREQQLSDPDTLRHYAKEIYQSSSTSPEVYEVSKFLYPSSLKDVNEEEIERIKELWNLRDSELNNRYNSLHDPEIPQDELIQIALVLQHNGFASGLYKYLSLINHSCIPNCIKFSPNQSDMNNWKYVSEIWSIQPIKAGEEITICYCDKIEIPYQSMRSYLLNQHRFLCHCSRCNSIQSDDNNCDIDIHCVRNENYLESILSSLELNNVLFDISDFPIEYSKICSHYFEFIEYEDIFSRSDFFSKTLTILLYVQQIIREILAFHSESLISSLSTSIPLSSSLTHNNNNNNNNNNGILVECFSSYDSRDLQYLLSRFHQIVIHISVKVIEYIYENQFQENYIPFEDKICLEVLCFVCESYIKHTYHLYSLQSNYLKFPDFHPLVGETLSHLSQSLQVAMKIDFLFPSIKSDREHKYNVLWQLYNENSTIYSWANSKTSTKAEIQRFNEKSQQIHSMYELSYEVLQRNLKSQTNIINYE